MLKGLQLELCHLNTKSLLYNIIFLFISTFRKRGRKKICRKYKRCNFVTHHPKSIKTELLNYVTTNYTALFFVIQIDKGKF